MVFLGGPTAVGKGALAIRLAGAFPVELVLCDSVKVYRGLEIGANKPSLELRAKVPIHLVDVCDPAERFSAGRYARLAAEAVAGIHDRGRIPLVVGGTLLFARALLDGLSGAPETDSDIERGLEALETGELAERLRRCDPVSADRIHPHDRQRLVRALAVHLQTGRGLSEWNAETAPGPLGGPVIRFALIRPRGDLYARIDERSGRMFERGLVEEVRGLLESGIPPSAPALESIGYTQAAACLRGDISPERAMEDTATATRRLAKRQLTWIRSDPRFVMLEADPTGEESAYDALARRLGAIS
ncbi:MAG: tRNA (adenosine(37)-N6)-dimethylallyltransferase MiaA [Candidatus Coatesbacteria bacterium RBG_13_66_14]|uniref:tRNA dimethylallyltransferase n=1 Tax=Candidatus Coatesbacteria bacterium RBG_13_66_14 TaxID=1817816 RepID=A0A1F5EXH1_9BACT|nr:MAG: tRNA (adenosine(37)-N6)-dimethylallyltransferase MiaA [Candidatus Coatesbacteria bacterium RBG_13_66_14]